MFDEKDFSGPEELLGDDDGAESVVRGGTGVADDVRGSERDVEC